MNLPRFGLLLVALAMVGRLQANPALEGYANYAAFAERVKGLDASELVAVSSLAKTAGGREILLLTLSKGDAAKKPAVVILGNVEASQLAGAELALRMAEQIAAQESDAVKQLLETMTLYIIPRPDPDATEKAFAAPFREVSGNLTATDDDRDGKFGEDPPEDLNGDGWITQIRVADEAGHWMTHPLDARVLIEADPKKNERGKFRLYSEGRDNDGDRSWNEDGGDGVALNRNWPHRYQPFQPGTGTSAVSEVESRAIADFLFERANVLAVLCFSPEENLFHTWKADAGKDKQKIRTTILSADAPFVDFLAGKYRELHGGKDAPEAAWPGGTFGEWSYFQYGRWTFAPRSWWLPKVPEKDDKKAGEEKRGAEELNALRWFEQEQIPGFVEWQKIEHPDFLGKLVEVGGFKPFYRKTPSVKLLDELATKHVSFVALLAEHRPKIAIRDPLVEALGGGVFRVTAKVAATGYLPTLPEMGEVVGIHQRLQIQLVLPEKTLFLKGSPRVKLGRIEAGGEKEVVWLVRLPEGPGEGKLRAWSPELGEVETALKFEK